MHEVIFRVQLRTDIYYVQDLFRYHTIHNERNHSHAKYLLADSSIARAIEYPDSP